MKINKHYKTFSIFIFILFLLIVFSLFVIVINSYIGISIERRILVAFLFILLIVLVSVLFYIAITNQDLTSSFTNRGPQLAPKDGEARQVQSLQDIAPSDEEAVFAPEQIIPRSAPNLEKFGEELLRNMADEFGIVQGLLYYRKASSDFFQCRAQYAYYAENLPSDFKFGETLPGQAVKNGVTAFISKVPENYLQVVSGLGKGTPREIVFVPISFKDEVVALIEYATFIAYDPKTVKNLNIIAHKVAETLVKLSKK